MTIDRRTIKTRYKADALIRKAIDMAGNVKALAAAAGISRTAIYDYIDQGITPYGAEKISAAIMGAITVEAFCRVRVRSKVREAAA